MKSVFLLVMLMIFNAFGQQDYPVPPKTNISLFYIQRNLNANTIQYDANFSENGDLNSEQPIKVYWIRYDETGEEKELKWIEQKFAYGVDCESIDGKQNEYKVELVADDRRVFTLKQLAPNKAKIYTLINGSKAELEHMYIQADNSGLTPTVLYIEFFGIDVKTHQSVYEKYMVDE